VSDLLRAILWLREGHWFNEEKERVEREKKEWWWESETIETRRSRGTDHRDMEEA
jgi:hypothetical protein